MITDLKDRSDHERVELRAFAKRLSGMMAERGYSQSDLARAIWGSTVDARGRDVAKNRDRINHYVNGRQMPEAKTIKKIADVFGVAPADLAPVLDRPEPAGGMDTVEMSMSVVGGTSPMMALLRIRKILPLGAATQIMAIVADADRADKREDTIS